MALASGILRAARPTCLLLLAATACTPSSPRARRSAAPRQDSPSDQPTAQTLGTASTPTTPNPVISASSPSSSPADLPVPVAAADDVSPSPPAIEVRKPTAWLADHGMPAQERVALAHSAKRAEVDRLFDAAGVRFPPAELLFRAFKREQLLEVWASSQRGGRHHHVASYEICALSGELGPKRSEGDGQVPEGFYRISYLWPLSAYHLAMNVGYPNRSDQILGGPQPGSAIMIHGNCVSIGCLAMSDERIQELWVMASAVQKGGQRIHVHLLPSQQLRLLLQDEALRAHWPFWRNLSEGVELFERHRRLPQVAVSWHGSYTFALPQSEPN